MCDERTQKDVDEFLNRSGVTRRQFGKLSGLSGFPNPETLNMTRSCADEA